jgi:hypothetical protein
MTAFWLGGCSIPRGIAFHQLALANSPLPKDAVRTKIANYPFVSMGDPVVHIEVESPQSSESLLAFYRDAFTAKGWQESETSRNKKAPRADPNDKHSGSESYEFIRKSYLGKWAYAIEDIELRIRDDGVGRTRTPGTIQATISLSGNYVWDVPSALAAKLFHPLGMPWGIVLTTPF